ncbi:hypothetical protein CEUSTIGMA_g2205.t1 [Chlamydomonas eustigma]|uniref:Plastid lipid-associated protein/fibrillin conserved domain-containing protein n=1 Tax=Chlamydomonas eustigma TaxID=1157962 RepID=A0A250WVB0_9CHLO|nr:hypothetical protein CEUSTIGMA_g2205.t1 [Chlamydomonas eustigma]|eukprot:GAX74758.1 hypothetical protein CEUSTIGMA_g2205.t1 [Chlamydomonas eustigma]
MCRSSSTHHDSNVTDSHRLVNLILFGNKLENRAEVNKIVNSLAASKLIFKESNLAGGPWVVVHNEGVVQLWRAVFEIFNIFTNNAQTAEDRDFASQTFDPESRTAVNRAEYMRGKIEVLANGTYQPEDDSLNCPKRIKVKIEGGLLRLRDTEIQLPFIQGTGTFDVMYVDECLRIFRSGNSLVVQIKKSFLDNMIAGRIRVENQVPNIY